MTKLCVAMQKKLISTRIELYLVFFLIFIHGGCSAGTYRDENVFGIFRYFRNRFRFFRLNLPVTLFLGNGIGFQIFYQKFRIVIEINVVFYRSFPLVIIFCQKLSNLCLRIFWNCLGIFRNYVPKFFEIFYQGSN